MEVDEDDARARAQRFDFFEHALERIVELLHEDAPHHVDDADRPSLGGAREIAAVAGDAGGEVGRPQEPRFGADVVDGLALRPDVVARGHDVDPPIQQLVAELPGDAPARGGIFGIGDDQVDVVVLY